jgi:anaerobic selenocysteine-containing dehydrogenase
MTPTAELADLVLPAAHWLETEISVRAAQSMGPTRDSYVLATRKVIDPVGECWDDRKIVLELAKKMGINTPWKDIDEFNDWMVEETGTTFKDIQAKRSQQLSFPIHYKKYESEGFKTPSGKVELYSTQ